MNGDGRVGSSERNKMQCEGVEGWGVAGKAPLAGSPLSRDLN